jgi:hypothetical protein
MSALVKYTIHDTALLENTDERSMTYLRTHTLRKLFFFRLHGSFYESSPALNCFPKTLGGSTTFGIFFFFSFSDF